VGTIFLILAFVGFLPYGLLRDYWLSLFSPLAFYFFSGISGFSLVSFNSTIPVLILFLGVRGNPFQTLFNFKALI